MTALMISVRNHKRHLQVFCRCLLTLLFFFHLRYHRICFLVLLFVHQMTGHFMAWRNFPEFWHFFKALLRCILTAFCKPAALRRVDRTWYLAFDRDSPIVLCLIRICFRNSRKKSFCVRMFRISVKFFRLCFLNYRPEIHNDYPV